MDGIDGRRSQAAGGGDDKGEKKRYQLLHNIFTPGPVNWITNAFLERND